MVVDGLIRVCAHTNSDVVCAFLAGDLCVYCEEGGELREAIQRF